MSLISRARHRDASPTAPSSASPEAAHANAVLATLGYQSMEPKRSVPGPVTRAVVVLLCVVAVVAGFWLGRPEPPSVPPTSVADGDSWPVNPPAPRSPSSPAVGRDGRAADGRSSGEADRVASSRDEGPALEAVTSAKDEPGEGATVENDAITDVPVMAEREAAPPAVASDAPLDIVRPSALPGDVYLPPESHRVALEPSFASDSAGVPEPEADEVDIPKGTARAQALLEERPDPGRRTAAEEAQALPGRRLGVESAPADPATEAFSPPAPELPAVTPSHANQFSDEELQALVELDIAGIRRRAAAGEAAGSAFVGDGGAPPVAVHPATPVVTRLERPSPVRRSPPPAPPPAGIAARAASRVQPDDFRVALRHHEDGEFEQAERRYRELIARNEADAEAHNNLGVLYEERGYVDEAIREFRLALAIDPAYVKAHNNLGVAYLGAARWDEAAGQFEQALALDSESLESLVNLGLAQNASGRSEDAVETLLRALDVDPRSAEAHYNLALVYDGRDASDRALEHYRLFLSLGTERHPVLAEAVGRRVELLATNRFP